MLLIKIILSWIPLPSQPLLDQAVKVLDDLTEPYLNIFRRILPTANLGGAGIDFSPIIGFFVLEFIRQIVVSILLQAGL